MADACVFVKSKNPQTYSLAVTRLLERYPDVRSIEWLFLGGTGRDDALLAGSLKTNLTTTVSSLEDWDDLRDHLRGVRCCDVSGLPKEDFAHVLASVLGQSGMRLCTLTRDPETPYVDLLSQPILKAFNRGYIARLAFFRALVVIVSCGLIALALLKVTDWIPNPQQWLTWIALALSVLGIVVSYAGLRRH